LCTGLAHVFRRDRGKKIIFHPWNLEGQGSISQISRRMGIFDSIFALPFGKIWVYGLIRPDFVVWALCSYNLPFAQFPKNKGIFESILALPPGINSMGSVHICIGFKPELCYLSGSWELQSLVSERFFFIPSRKTLIPRGPIHLSYLESLCLFPLDVMEKRERDVSGRASYSEQQKLEFVTVIPTHLEGCWVGQVSTWFNLKFERLHLHNRLEVRGFGSEHLP